jgi:1-deoxy-D-xylulose-5-phosphate synthase
VLELAAKQGWLATGRLYPLTLPDEYQLQNSPAAQYDDAGLNAAQIADKAVELLQNQGEADVRRHSC